MHAVRHRILLGGSSHAEEEQFQEAFSESTDADPSKGTSAEGYPIIKPFIVCSKLLGS